MDMLRLLLCMLGIFWTDKVNSEVQFEEVETIFKLNDSFPSINETEHVIRTIDQDITQPGRFYFATETALFVVDGLLEGNTTGAELLVGDIEESGFANGIGSESRFNGIFGMVQIEQPKRIIIVTDRWNHCLRSIEQSSLDTGNLEWKASVYAGRGNVPGSFSGRRENSNFNKPIGILRKDNYLFIADSGNKRIQRLDIYSSEISTVHESGQFGPIQMIFGSSDNEFLVTANNGVLRVQGDKETWVVGSEHGRAQRKFTQFSSATFAQPAGIVRLDDVILVADGRPHSIKIVDLQRQEVRAMGKGYGIKDGNIDECKFREPKALTTTDELVIIGEAGRIRILPYKIFKENSTDQYPTTFYCDKPPSIPNAVYQPREYYPAGSAVYYQCTERYTSKAITSHLTCTKTPNSLIWKGQEIQCTLSDAFVTAIALGGVSVVCLVIVLVMGIRQCKRKLRVDKNQQAIQESQTGQANTQTSILSRRLPVIENSQGYYESMSEPYIDIIEGKDDSSASGEYHDASIASVETEYTTTEM